MGRQIKTQKENNATDASSPARPEVAVLYIHPAKQGLDFRPDTDFGRPYGLIPVGLPALVNLLGRNGIPVRGISHALELQLDRLFNLKTWIAAFPVKAVLIDMHWYEHCYGQWKWPSSKEVQPQA
jgi:hypothetical protein